MYFGISVSSIFIPVILAGTAQAMEDAGFAPTLTWDSIQSVAEISWPTQAGKRYHFQRSTDAETWTTLAEIYGTGGFSTLRVQETPSANGNPPGGEPPETVVARNFVICAFPNDNQRELLSLPSGRRVLLETGTIVVPVPQFLAVSVPGDPGTPPTPVVALRADRPWDPVFALDPALQESSLSPEDAALRDLFLAALILNHNGGGTPAPLGVAAAASDGQGALYRVGVENTDTDHDGIPDWKELERGLDP